MAEPFNVEQFRQKMSGQASPQPPQAPSAMPAQGQPQMMPAQASPQPYQAAQMQQPQMQQTQAQPRPYQPQVQMPQPQHAPQQQHYAMPPVAQPMAQPSAPPQMQAQARMPHPQQVQSPQGYAPQMTQPQTPMHHMPPPPVFTAPPVPVADIVEEAPKKSRFSLKRFAKTKTLKVPKIKKSEKLELAAEMSEASDVVHTSNTSPALIFMFGMATGIACFLVGNMLMSTFLADNSPQSFRDIERQNAQAQQLVLPRSVQNADNTTETATP